MLKFNFKDICALAENLFTGLGLFLKCTYLLVPYSMGCVSELGLFLFVWNMISTQQLGDGVTPMMLGAGVAVC